ncbi:MAG TPA: carboxypeptidase-like regulatory domain-containing protein [Terriglobia bacterium]|nr:carboxypeptidase-like regulatory domain-containing protein [Terriglobia bacterium]
MPRMIKFLGLILGLLLTLSAQTSAPVHTATLIGEIAPSASVKVTRPVKVVMLSETYTNMYDREALQRIDEYWEQFKPAFLESKELFYQVSQVAQSEAIEFVVSRMRQDGVDLSRMQRDTSADGRFEFRNVPPGEYKIVAYGSMGSSDFVWQGWTDLESSEPVRIQLKTTLP